MWRAERQWNLHQEAPECLHDLQEGGEGKCDGRSENHGQRHRQLDPRPQGESLDLWVHTDPFWKYLAVFNWSNYDWTSFALLPTGSSGSEEFWLAKIWYQFGTQTNTVSVCTAITGQISVLCFGTAHYKGAEPSLPCHKGITGHNKSKHINATFDNRQDIVCHDSLHDPVAITLMCRHNGIYMLGYILYIS